ncbi:carbamoyltransferase C-terminal domain-containing protein [Pseudomonas sp. SDO5271_S396]
MSYKANSTNILGIKDGHDGAIALITGNHLTFCMEAEKDNEARFSSLTPNIVLKALELIKEPINVTAQSGWSRGTSNAQDNIGAGYFGLTNNICKKITLLGQNIKYFTSSHERSHLLCAYGLSPFPQGQPCYALLWEGQLGAFYRIDENVNIKRLGTVIDNPGDRFAFLYGIADPTFNFGPGQIRLSDAGKLMALAAYGKQSEIDDEDQQIISFLLDKNLNFRKIRKDQFKDSPYYNMGVDNPRFASLAHHFSNAIFEMFCEFSKKIIFDSAPLLITGGCGLNCDWNSKWIETQLFSDVFIPPCSNDSGSAIGTAIDALLHTRGIAKVIWSPYSGAPPCDNMLNTNHFIQVSYEPEHVATLLNQGHIFGWVQGKYEIGPRALGNRSILAAPFPKENLAKLNKIKNREGFRPIAPLCLEEYMCDYFHPSHPSPYMLEFRTVVSALIPAVTHVDNSARPQSINQFQNPKLYTLLVEFKKLSGVAVLCNTSLNFNGRGFINSSSDLCKFSIEHELDGFIFNDKLFLKKKINENIE